MGVAYLTLGPITVVTGKTYRIAIDAPPRGEIVRAQCIETSGTPVIFTFTFYNSAKSCPPNPPGQPVNTAGDATVDKMTEYAGQVGPARVVSTAKDRFLGSDGSDGGWTSAGSYVNADGTGSTAKGKLYMKFDAGGAGTFLILLTIKTDRG